MPSLSPSTASLSTLNMGLKFWHNSPSAVTLDLQPQMLPGANQSLESRNPLIIRKLVHMVSVVSFSPQTEVYDAKNPLSPSPVNLRASAPVCNFL